MTVVPLRVGDGTEWPYGYAETAETSMVVDLAYQREEIPVHIKNIAYAFDWRLFQPIVLSDRGRTMAVLDGHQRLAGIRLGNELGLFRDASGGSVHLHRLPSLVYSRLSKAEEAKLYIDLNEKTRHVKPVERWKARLVYKDPNVVQITALLKEYGVSIGDSRQPGMVKAVVSLEDVWSTRRQMRGRLVRHGPEALDRTLAAIKKSWEGVDGALGGDVIAGVGTFFLRFSDPEIDFAVLDATMRSHWPKPLVEAAGRDAGGTRAQDARTGSFARRLATEYNKMARRAKVKNLPIADRFKPQS